MESFQKYYNKKIIFYKPTKSNVYIFVINLNFFLIMVVLFFTFSYTNKIYKYLWYSYEVQID